MSGDMYPAVDIHSHVLFGVDDGAGDIRESLALLRLDYEEGARAVFATPHFGIENGYAPDATSIQRRFDELQQIAAEEMPDLSLYLGTEWYCADGVAQRIKNQMAYRMNETDCVLVEFLEYGSFTEASECMHQRLRQLQQAGYRPILAHPERYRALRKNRDWLMRFFDMGIMLQVNAYDIALNPKDDIRETAQWLARERMITFTGSDMHGLPPKRPPKLQDGIRWLYENTDRAYADNVAVGNAQKILNARPFGK